MNGAYQNGLFYFGIFFNETWHICIDYVKIITWKFHWNHPRNKWCRANIVQNVYYGKCKGKRDFTQQFFNFCKKCFEYNFKILTDVKIKFKKTKLFLRSARYFCTPLIQTYGTVRTKRICTVLFGLDVVRHQFNQKMINFMDFHHRCLKYK
jgi:hypothetical protein